jgi:hypothetical protein
VWARFVSGRALGVSLAQLFRFACACGVMEEAKCARVRTPFGDASCGNSLCAAISTTYVLTAIVNPRGF